MRRVLFVLAVAGIFFALPLRAQGRHVSEEIKPYIEHIRAHGMNPVDYVMELFGRYDVVILCEASHPEMTAYELVGEIISDRRFIDNVGCVMTETGSYVLKEKFAELFAREDFDEQMLLLARNLYHGAYWEKTNYYGLLKDIYRVNKGGGNISYIPLDIPFSWRQTQGWTSVDYNRFADRVYPARDQIMAANAVTELIKIFDGGGPRKKALIILNSRHAYRYYENKSDIESVAGVIFAQFPGRVANVMLHDVVPDDEDREEYDRLKADGRWDAAFAALGNPPTGFDFGGSPFGRDTFESWIEPVEPLLYEDVFTGYIFYKSPFEWVDSWGYEGLISDDFADEALRRLDIFPARGDYRRESLMRNNTVHTSMPHKDHETMRSQLRKHFRE